MKIVITTGIYPPAIGGPAQYAKNLGEAFRGGGHQVKILTYRLEKYLPVGVRHFWFYVRALVGFIGADLVITLDTLSVGWPSVCVGKFLGKKVIIRTGGDFLWESYVERTGDLVLLREFYTTSLDKLSFKERLIFNLTKFTLRKSNNLVFSTDWQRKIWTEPYDLDLTKTAVIENFYGEKLSSSDFRQKNFIAASRSLKLKNKVLLRQVFDSVAVRGSGVCLEDSASSYEELRKRLEDSYAIIVPSISEISPNLILEAIRLNKPFIATCECGLFDKLKEIGLFVDPKNSKELEEKIIFLADANNYRDYQNRIRKFTFSHSWQQIAKEFLNLNG